MAVNIGSGGLQRSFVGDKEVNRIYVGTKYAWPSVPSAKVQWVGSVVATGSTNTFPAHQPGDLLVVAAGSATNAIPGIPAGFTSVLTNNSGLGFRLGYNIATSSSVAVGTWSGAAYNTAYVFRYANTNTPFGGFAAVSENKGTSPSITMQDTSGDSLLCYGFYNNGTTGGWYATPDGWINKNGVARMGNLQKIDSRSDGAITWGGNFGTVNFKNWLFEVLPESEVEQVGLYGCDVEYLPNYEVKFTAKTSYAADPEEAFFFRSTPMTNDGYTARTFTKTYRSTATPITCTLEDYWANPTGIRNTITFTIMPKA